MPSPSPPPPAPALPSVRGVTTIPWAWSAAVGAAFGTLYLALAPPVSGNKDAGEFTLALALAGVPHPTGYPLFTLLGHAFVVLLHRAGASWGFAANAWSATGAAAAMALFHALASRVVPASVPRLPRFALALAATAVAGLNPVWLLDAVVAEVYSWHLAWVCGACLATLAILRALATPRPGRERGTDDPDGRRATLVAAGWGLLAGTGLAHHATSVMFIVPLATVLLIALTRARRRRASFAAIAAASALIPLASYGFVVYRAWHPAAFQWQTLDPSLASVLAHVTGAEYRDLLGRFAPSEMQRGLFRSFIYPVLVPGLAGLLWFALRARAPADRLALGAFAAAAALQTAYGFSYAVADPSSYFHPAMAAALLAAPLAGARMLRSRRAAPVGAAVAAAALVALGAWWLPLGADIRSDMVAIEGRAHRLWRSIDAPEGIVLWRDDMLPLLRGYQLLDGEGTGLYVQDPYMLTWPGPRRAFTARFGFDPLEGMRRLTARELDRIGENINRQTDLPVIVFDVSRTTTTTLPKPPTGTAATETAPGVRQDR